MGKSYADVLIERGWEKGHEAGRQKGQLAARKEMLLRQLRRRFGELPEAAVGAVAATHDVEQLNR